MTNSISKPFFFQPNILNQNTENVPKDNFKTKHYK